MNLLQHKASLKTKLSVLVSLAVMIVVVVLGLYFDNSMKNRSFANAHTRISHGYQRLAYNLKNIEDSLKEGIAFINSDEQLPASVELINNYQNKNNYDTYLLDEEKKLLAAQLLNQVKFSFNNVISLYDKSDELIAYVIKHDKEYKLNYISYEKSKVKLFSRYESQNEYTTVDDSKIYSKVPHHHKNVYDPKDASKTSLITYDYLGNDIIIKSHQYLIDKETKKIIGHIELSRLLDAAYFKELSQTLNIDIKHSFNVPLNEDSYDRLILSSDQQKINIIQNKDSYSAVLKKNSLNGNIYYIANLNKRGFNAILNENRRKMFLILTLLTLLMLVVMRYIINYGLDRPLAALMKQVNKIEHQDYSESDPVKTGDELESASININRLAHVIQERESSLKMAMEEQSQLSVKVRDSEAQLYTLIQTLPDLVWLKDPDGVYLSCNKKFEKLFGAKEVDIVGKTDYDFVTKELADFFRKHDKDAIVAGKPSVNEEEVTYADDGHHEILETIKTPMLGSDGSIIGILGVGRDITERKQIEEKLKKNSSQLEKIASRLPGMVYQFEQRADGSMHFPYISDAINDVYDLTAKEVQDDVSKIFDVTHPDDIDKLYSTIKESARTLTPWKLEYKILDKNGNVRWLYGNSIPEKRSGGDILWHGFVTDITKNKELDETLRRSQKMDALGKLTGGIAHDYNNMLGVVLGYAELLKAMLDENAEQQDYVDQIIHAADRGAKLTNKLLSFSRNKTVDAEPLDINKVLKGELHMLEKTLTARIQLDMQLDKNLWPACLDESELEDSILNLSINAMHAIENNGQLTIATSNDTVNDIDGEQLELESGDYVRICVSDTGCGIDDTIKQKIFDPFYSTKGSKGTGLGLTQVYGFVKRSGGTIKVDSTHGVGTKFTLYFPRFKGDNKKVTQAEAEDNTVLKGNEIILVVDDEVSLLKLAKEILSLHGYHVLCADNAQQALEIMNNESIDILLSDVIMPNMDGYELASIVQEKYPKIKIQLVSGFAGEKNYSADNPLSDNLLKKPYTEKSLLRKIKGLLQ